MLSAFKAAKWTVKLAILAGLLVVGFLAYNFVDDYFSKGAETQAELSQNQTEAAIESGKDTVTTINNQHTREITRSETVRELQGRINEAPDAHSAHTAGIDGLCDITSSLCPEDVVQ